MGWLHARPKLNEKDTQPRANIENYPHPEDPIKNPPRGDAYLAQAFIDCGMRGTSGMGDTPLSWQEIDAFCTRSWHTLSAWDCMMIRKMSEAYVNQKAMSTATKYKEPWDGWHEVVQDDSFPQDLWDEILQSRKYGLDDVLEQD